ncbi:MAG: hypothetical protein OCD02_15425 [Spirochaetaceae bacterium]
MLDHIIMNIHGEFKVETKNNIINSILIGSFNVEGSKAYYKELEKAILDIKTDYYTLINLLKFEGATHEAYVIANNFNKRFNIEKPAIKRIIVINNDFLEIITKSEVHLAFMESTLVFNTMEGALNWFKKEEII